MKKTYTILVVLVIISNLSITYAQDIEEIAQAPIMATNGGISLSQIAYFSPDTNNNQEPYSWYLSGNLNTSLFGVVSLPFSFAYTNNQATANLSQPFNRFSLSPSYKWVTTHIGYSSMSFSPYTLAGHEFFGGGLELTPNKSLKFAAMYGRLQKAANGDTLGSDPSYRRMGGGFKIEYLNKYVDASFNVFKAKEDAGSLHFDENDTAFLKPVDNLCGSVAVNFKPIESLSVSFEYALSVLNEDISRSDSSDRRFRDNFLESTGDQSLHNAYKASVSQSSKIGKIGATYERVSPNYRTLGAYYFHNDFENITANFSTSIKKWLTLAVDAGYQKDNLEEQKTNRSSRFIYSVNASSALTKRLSLAASLSNLQTYVHIKDIYSQVTQTNEYENLDTLSYTQLNLTESVNVNYLLQSTKEKRQNINASFTYQEASEKQEDDQSFTGNTIYNTTVSYLFTLIPQRFTASATVNYNRNIMPEMTLNVMSYNLSLQKAFFEKFKAAFIGTYSNSNNQEEIIADIINLRLTCGYTLKKRHNFNLSGAMVNNKGLQGTSTQYSVNLSYSYMFNFLVDRENKKYKFKGNF